jgi:hypothetical protein
VYAISYDPVATLARFAAGHGITYPLLADVGSRVITELGLRNVTIEQERAAYGRTLEERHRGLPYPGTFFLDEAGMVVDKRFEQSHRIRPTGRNLLARLLGDDALEPAVTAAASSPGVEVAAWLDSAVVAANQIQDLHLRLQLDDGVHLYAHPVPDGFRALEVTVGGPAAIRVEPVAPPPGTEFHMAGLAETFFVLEDVIDLRVPFLILSNRDTAGDAAVEVAVEVALEYQACTDLACFVPERIELQLPLRLVPNPGYESTDAAAVEPLVLRRLVEGPRVPGVLLEEVNEALHGVALTPEALEGVLAAMSERGLVHRDAAGAWHASPDA